MNALLFATNHKYKLFIHPVFSCGFEGDLLRLQIMVENECYLTCWLAQKIVFFEIHESELKSVKRFK